jgi:putative tricarboxylic transport membrane protein
MSLGRDGVAGLVLFGISLALLVQAFQLPSLPIVPVGPGFYPGIVLVLMAVMSALLVVQDLGRRPEPADTAAPRPMRNYRLVVTAFAIVAAYIFLLPLLGFRLATALFVAVLQAMIDRPGTARGWAAVLAVAVGTAFVTHLVFERYLLVLLPRGTWTGF